MGGLHALQSWTPPHPHSFLGWWERTPAGCHAKACFSASHRENPGRIQLPGLWGANPAASGFPEANAEGNPAGAVCHMPGGQSHGSPSGQGVDLQGGQAPIPGHLQSGKGCSQVRQPQIPVFATNLQGEGQPGYSAGFAAPRNPEAPGRLSICGRPGKPSVWKQ